MKYIYVGYYQVVEAKYVKIKAQNKPEAEDKLKRYLLGKHGNRALIDLVTKQNLGGGTGLEPSEEFIE